MLHWARANGCEWDANTCRAVAAHGGQLATYAAMARGELLRLECEHVPRGGARWALQFFAMTEGERLRLGREHVPWGGARRAPGRAAVAAGERLD
jgi:hypothetical protein